jgi:hypothetical protein
MCWPLKRDRGKKLHNLIWHSSPVNFRSTCALRVKIDFQCTSRLKWLRSSKLYDYKDDKNILNRGWGFFSTTRCFTVNNFLNHNSFSFSFSAENTCRRTGSAVHNASCRHASFASKTRETAFQVLYRTMWTNNKASNLGWDLIPTASDLWVHALLTTYVDMSKWAYCIISELNCPGPNTKDRTWPAHCHVLHP